MIWPASACRSTVSELDISFGGRRMDFRSAAQKRRCRRGRPRRWRTPSWPCPSASASPSPVWGLREPGSWLRHPPNAATEPTSPWPSTTPAVPKPMFDALAAAFRG
ncbi:MAG: hypothetical protein WDM92_15345 [Caulobacteraceae bacterium]